MKWLKERLKAWWLGDDGHLYGVLTAPSPYREDESRFVGPLTRSEAHRIAKKYRAANPEGKAAVMRLARGSEWLRHRAVKP